jgi:glycosyltransferase involved in cell wall biosynthesis
VGLLNVLKALAGRYAVDVLTLRPASGELPFVERFMKARMLRVPVAQGPNVTLGEQVDAFRRAVKRQLEGEEYDVVHLHSAWGGRAVVEGAEPSKVVYEVARSTEGEPRAADAELARALADEEARCLARADLVLVPTRTGRAHLTRGGTALAKKGAQVVIVPPGVDVDHFDWEPSFDAAERPERVLYAGRISAGRGVRLLLQAVATLGRANRRRPVRLLLAGPVDEPFRAPLEQAIEARGLADTVELLGPIDHDDMPRVIAQADVCVAPASPDQQDRPLAGFPTKLLEYMACRRPVVAPRRPSVEELVEDREHGLLFEPGSADDLARAIGELLDDRALGERLATAGYLRVRDQHPASATRRRLLEAYARIVPAERWSPPGRAASPVDGLPAHLDTTTARRPLATVLPDNVSDGRAHDERSGEIVIGVPPPEPKVEPGEVIVIDAIDFATAGEPRDTADLELSDTSEPLAAPKGPADGAAGGLEPSQGSKSNDRDPFGEDSSTSPFLRSPMSAVDAERIQLSDLPAEADPAVDAPHETETSTDEETGSGPLPSKKPSS